MSANNRKIRLHVAGLLAPGQPVSLRPEQVHYLHAVLRMQAGDMVHVFNGSDGEWRAELTALDRRGGRAECRDMTQPQGAPPDLWLCFSPLKRQRTDFLVEKAVEMGVAQLMPLQMARTNAERIKPEKQALHAMEAAEQCGATWVPPLLPLQGLGAFLDAFPDDRVLICADERGSAPPLPQALPAKAARAAILIGPEGGFSEAEFDRLGAMKQVVRAGLGPRVLRAETAAVAALALWQSARGDWR
jgi:16S rRNA (uracil1498-N3)-methyltransferase